MGLNHTRFVYYPTVNKAQEYESRGEHILALMYTHNEKDAKRLRDLIIHKIHRTSARTLEEQNQTFTVEFYPSPLRQYNAHKNERNIDRILRRCRGE